MEKHKHIWKRDTARKHGRPPRIFAKCDCGAKTQAVMLYGYIHPFSTHKPSNPHAVKKPYSIRLSDIDVRDIKNGRTVIVISDNRLRLQYKS